MYHMIREDKSVEEDRRVLICHEGTTNTWRNLFLKDLNTLQTALFDLVFQYSHLHV